MQWLIDLIIDAIGVPPCFIERGDPSGYDFMTGYFTIDAAWHEMDLSAIVPAGAKAVSMYAIVQTTTAARYIMFEKNGNVNHMMLATFRTQVANQSMTGDLICAVDEDRKIQYRIEVASWTLIFVNVKGWWL